MVTHHEVVAVWNTRGRVVVVALELLRHEVIVHRYVVDVDDPVDDAYVFAFFCDHTLDERLIRVDGVVEHHDIAAARLADAIGQLVHDQAVLIGERRRHALPFDTGNLKAKGDDQGGVDGCRRERLEPGDEFVLQYVQPMYDERGSGTDRDKVLCQAGTIGR